MGKGAAACKDVIKLDVYRLYTTGIRTTDSPAEPATITPPTCEPYSSLPFPEGWADIDPFESYRSVFNGQLDEMSNPELILLVDRTLAVRTSVRWSFINCRARLRDGIRMD